MFNFGPIVYRLQCLRCASRPHPEVREIVCFPFSVRAGREGEKYRCRRMYAVEHPL